jgi:hypothetical protein
MYQLAVDAVTLLLVLPTSGLVLLLVVVKPQTAATQASRSLHGGIARYTGCLLQQHAHLAR